jgi:hypothetical protein
MTVRVPGRAYWAFTLATALFVTLRYALMRGQDFNWDQQNYHIGVAFLLAHGTYWTSIAPAGIQGYFNPLLQQIEFEGMRELSPKGFAIALALVQSLAFMMAASLCRAIAGRGAEMRTVLPALLGFVLCLLAPIALSEAGTTFIDLPTAALVLGAYALLAQRGLGIRRVPAGALAGVLMGAAVALKLTNAVFAVGIAGFVLAGQDTLRQRIQWMVACGVGAVLAFLLIGGAWHYQLWVRFGNPFFPFYNGVFRSPDYPPVSFHDTRFLPHSVLDIWRYPLYWLLGGSPRPDTGSPSSELAFRDPRWAIAVFGATAFLISLLLFRRWGRERLRDQTTGLLFAFLISYVIWLATFGIHRYATTLDILCGAIILVLAQAVGFEQLRLPLLFAALMLSWRVMTVPDWGHVPWKDHSQAFATEPVDTGGPTIVFLTEKPSSFVAASLPPETRYVGLYSDIDLHADNGTSLTRQLHQALASGSVKLKEVDSGALPDFARSVLASYALRPTDRCEALHFGAKTMRLCDVRRES